ncbi:MAG: hypothetical protein ACXV5J_12020, partial [Candidatus Angelobacter sp.]
MEQRYSWNIPVLDHPFSEIPTLSLPKGREPYRLIDLWAKICEQIDEVTALKSSRRKLGLYGHTLRSSYAIAIPPPSAIGTSENASVRAGRLLLFSEIPTLSLLKGREPYRLMDLWAKICEQIDEVTALKSSRRKLGLYGHTLRSSY